MKTGDFAKFSSTPAIPPHLMAALRSPLPKPGKLRKPGFLSQAVRQMIQRIKRPRGKV